MKKLFCSAPGKVIITGEHSVVYGQPALLTAFDLRIVAEIRKIKGNRLRLVSDKLRGGWRSEKQDAIAVWKKAKEAWEEFDKNGSDKELRLLRKNKSVVMVCAAGLALEEIGKFEGGVEIKLKSELPIISGFGSSAYTAAVVIGGLTELFLKNRELQDLRQKVFEIEKIMHGKPSGADPTVIVYGGWLKFRKSNAGMQFKKIKIGKKLTKNIMFVNSGKAVESTGEMVQRVYLKVNTQKSKYKELINKIGEVSGELIEHLQKGSFEPELLRENERLLEELGVVGEKAKLMVRRVEKAGGAAKICGGGGVKKGSGLMLLYHQDSGILRDIVHKGKWQVFKAELGGEGWRRE